MDKNELIKRYNKLNKVLRGTASDKRKGETAREMRAIRLTLEEFGVGYEYVGINADIRAK